jgi:hypothetical protein
MKTRPNGRSDTRAQGHSARCVPVCHEASLLDLSESERINADVRTENDTWDIKTSVGSTALFVATARALEAQKPNPVVIDPYAEVFCRAAGAEWAGVLDGGAPDHPLKTEFRTPDM